MAEKKLLIFTDTLALGGVGRVVANLSTQLSERIPTELVLFDQSRVDFVTKSHITSLDLIPPPYESIFNEVVTFIRAVLKILKIKKNATVCISFKELPNFINIITKRKKVIIISVREHKSRGIRFDKNLSRWLAKLLIRFCYNNATKVVCVSKGIMLDLVDNWGIRRDRCEVIYNFVDYDRISFLTKEKIDNEFRQIFNAESKIVISVGRLEREKGYWHLIRSFSVLVSLDSSFRLVIVGEGSEEKYLKRLVTELDLTEYVTFTGFQSNPYKYIYKSDVFVLSSLWEGLPNVVLEAMACGTPVVATDCLTGPKEILDPSYSNFDPVVNVLKCQFGILTPPLDGIYKSSYDRITNEEKILANAIKILFDDVQLYKEYKDKCKIRCDDFSPLKISRQWIDLINKTVAVC